MLGCRGKLRAIRGRRDAIRVREARRERADALQPDREADICHGAVGCAQQRGGALEAPGEQVGVGGFAVRAPKLATEVGAGQTGGAGEILHPQLLEVPRVSEILCPQEVTGWRNKDHERSGYPGEGPLLPSSNC